MDDGALSDSSTPFVVFGRNHFAVHMGLVLGAAAIVPLVLAWIADREMGWMALAYSLFMGANGALLFAAGLRGLEIEANDHGIRWRYAFVSRFHAWADIESIGRGQSKVMEPADHPTARAIVGSRRFVPDAGPIIGINLKVTNKDRGMAAYRRGFNGYDSTIEGYFEMPASRIIEILQARLEYARCTQSMN